MKCRYVSAVVHFLCHGLRRLGFLRCYLRVQLAQLQLAGLQTCEDEDEDDAQPPQRASGGAIEMRSGGPGGRGGAIEMSAGGMGGMIGGGPRGITIPTDKINNLLDQQSQLRKKLVLLERKRELEQELAQAKLRLQVCLVVCVSNTLCVALSSSATRLIFSSPCYRNNLRTSAQHLGSRGENESTNISWKSAMASGTFVADLPSLLVSPWSLILLTVMCRHAGI